MKPTTYICEKYPALSIGSTKAREVKFRLGRFVATERWQVELIESNEWFDCFIFLAEPHTIEPIKPSPQAIHTSAKRGDETLHSPPEGGDQTHISEVKSGGEDEPKAPPPPPPEVKPEVAEAFGGRPEYVVSDTAKEVLVKAGVSVDDAAKSLELADGDRLTVKMAEGLING